MLTFKCSPRSMKAFMPDDIARCKVEGATNVASLVPWVPRKGAPAVG